MDKNVKEELDKICLEEDYQQDIDNYYDSLFGPGDRPCVLSYEEDRRRTKLFMDKLKEWEKKLNGKA